MKKFGVDLDRDWKDDGKKPKEERVYHTRYLSDGEIVKVKIPSLETGSLQFSQHSIFFAKGDKRNVLPFVCESYRTEGGKDLWDLMFESYRNDSNYYKFKAEPKDEVKAKALWDLAYPLQARERHLFGFWDVAKNQPMFISLSKDDAKLLTDSIGDLVNEYEGVMPEAAFALKYTVSGKSKNFKLTKIKALPAEEQANFDAAPSEFTLDMYENELYFRTEEQQARALITLGHDLNRIDRGDLMKLSDSKPYDGPTPSIPKASTTDVGDVEGSMDTVDELDGLIKEINEQAQEESA